MSGCNGNLLDYKDKFVGQQCRQLFELKSVRENSIIGSLPSLSGMSNHVDGKSICDSWSSLSGSFASREANHAMSMSSLFDHELGQVVDNSPALLNKMASLCDNDELSDIELVVTARGNDDVAGKSVFRAHKLILCCSSDVLRIMLLNPVWPDSMQQCIEFKEEPECAKVFSDFLHYMYTGRILLTQDSVLPVLMLADKYNVIDLQDVCSRYMNAHLVSTTQQNRSISWFQYSANAGHHQLATTCYQFILWNFYKVACSPDFLVMDAEVLISFLRLSDLVIPDELTLFRCASRWICHHRSECRGELNRSVVIEILSLIRFAMIPPSQLGLVAADSLFAEYADFFDEQIANSLAFHSSVGSPADCTTEQNKTKFSSSSYEPRNYTNEVWSTTLSVEEYSSFAAYDVRPVFFSTPASAAMNGDTSSDAASWEWMAELFPKGVHFSKFIMIRPWRNIDVSGAHYETVRLVIAAKSPEMRKTNIAVLITGVQDGVEYIRRVVQRRWFFDDESQLCQMNDLVPYSELNCPNSTYLSGSEGKTFKIMIVIKPVVEASQTTS